MDPVQGNTSPDSSRTPESPAGQPPSTEQPQSNDQPLALRAPKLAELDDVQLLDRARSLQDRLVKLENVVIQEAVSAVTKLEVDAALGKWSAEKSTAKAEFGDCVAILADRLVPIFEKTVKDNPKIIQAVLEPFADHVSISMMLKRGDEKTLRVLFGAETDGRDVATRALFCEALIIEAKTAGAGKELIQKYAQEVRASQEPQIESVPIVPEASGMALDPKHSGTSFFSLRESVIGRGIVAIGRGVRRAINWLNSFD